MCEDLKGVINVSKTQAPNSDHAANDSIDGSAGDFVSVTCDVGYEGGGDWICQPDGTWIGTSCTKITEE